MATEMARPRRVLDVEQMELRAAARDIVAAWDSNDFSAVTEALEHLRGALDMLTRMERHRWAKRFAALAAEQVHNDEAT